MAKDQTISKFELGLAAIGSVSVVALSNWLFHAPIRSYDSAQYLVMAGHMSDALGKWQPAGLPALLWLFFQLSSALPLFLTLVSGLRLFLIYLAIRFTWSRRYALGFALILASSPAWMMLSATLWSEAPFALWMAVALATVVWVKPGYWRMVGLGLVYSALVQTRYAGVFFLPAFVFAGAARETAGGLAIRFKPLGLAAIFFGILWAGNNYFNSGLPFQPTRTALGCFSGLTSVNELPYCEWGVARDFCALDPERKYLNQSDPTGFYGMSRFQTDPQSPLPRYLAMGGPSGLCAVLHDVMWAAAVRAPLDIVSILTLRVWHQFGAWREAERSDPTRTEVGPLANGKSMELLDRLLRIARQFQFLHQMMLLGLIAALVRRKLGPTELFLLLASLGHALGLAMNNPFLALRYMAIHKLGVYLAFVIAAGRWRSMRLRS